MKKLLPCSASLLSFSLLAIAQDGTNAGQSWSGLLVASGCRASAAAIGTNQHAGSDPAMPRSTNTPAREQNATYEQTQNQADRPRPGSVPSQTASKDRDQMARTTDRGSVVDPKDDPMARVTTPPIDDKGTRGKATINNTAVQDASNRAEGVKEADRTASNMTSGRSDSDSAKGMDGSCRIGQNTSAFALRLADGKLVQFDEASNSKISQQLKSGDRLQHKTKIFRAKVKGSLQNGAISADSIQM